MPDTPNTTVLDTDEEKSSNQWTPEVIRDISEAVYRDRLGINGVKSMLANDADDGKKLRQRAGCYDPLTRSYLRILYDKANQA